MSEPSIPQSEKPDGAAAQEYLEQLLSTERFRKAPVLRQLLEYLVTKAAEGRTDEIKESIIAIDVFGRSQGFDNRLDNIVRVQAHRLRKLLETHYEGEGANDKFVISIPKGSYVPQVRRRQELQTPVIAEAFPIENPPEAAMEPPAQFNPPAATKAARRRPAAALALCLAATFCLGALAALVVAPRIAPSNSRASSSAEDLRKMPLAALWGDLVSKNETVVLSFTNPVFLWTPTGRTPIYMTYRGPMSAPNGTQVEISPQDPFVDPEFVKRRGPFFFSDSWTGTGEVFGAHRLTKLFTEAGKPLKVMRSRSMTYEDLRDASVIFLGSTWANELQDRFNAEETPLVCYGREKVVNREPRSGEPAEFLPVYDPKTKELMVSYVLFSVLPGLRPGAKIIASAGIQTYGTYAGIEYMTSAAGISELIRRFDSTGRKGLPGHFQAVIRHEMVRGEPANPSLVLVRELDGPRASKSAASR